MKKFPSLTLSALGIIEIFWGLVWGRLRIYTYESPFARELGYPHLSRDQIYAFNKYIDIYKDQWKVVAWFGILTLVFGLYFYIKSFSQKD